MKWTYNIIKLPPEDDLLEKLNELGEQGWECFKINEGYESEIFIKKIKSKESKKDNLTLFENSQIKSIIDHLNRQLNSNYSPNSKSTKLSILARLKESYILDDFVMVIDSRISEWKDDDKMKQYLRPETLFGSKFESYLNFAILNKPKEQTNTSIKGLIL